MKIALPAIARAMLERQLPSSLTVIWHESAADAIANARDVEAAWFDSPAAAGEFLRAASTLRWFSTSFAGIDALPLNRFHERGIGLTNGVGLYDVPVSEFVVGGMLALAKGLPDLVRAHDRKEWVEDAPAAVELSGSSALILGYGHIGRAIGARLRALGMSVTGVRRNPGGEPDVIGPEDWRARVSEFDWLVLAAPLTGATRRLLDADAIRNIKRGARVVNTGRGGLIDQAALIDAATRGHIAAALLDVTEPEPLPPDNPLWAAPAVVVTSHSSGRTQGQTLERATMLFLDNLRRYVEGQPLRNLVDLKRGY